MDNNARPVNVETVAGQPVPAELKSNELVATQQGAVGTQIYGGIVTNEEYNRELTQRAGLKLFDQMRRSDGTTKAALLAVKLPIEACDWTVQEASDSDQDVMIANFVRHCLFENINFTNWLKEALTCLDFGHSVGELMYDYQTFEGKRLIALMDIQPRKQTSIMRWIKKSTGELGITQFVAGADKQYFEVDWNKLLVISNEREGNNYPGVSLLRAAYKHWAIKQKLEKIEAIKLEKMALGVPVITVPPGAVEEDIKAAITAARNSRANEEGYIRVPLGFTVEIMDMKASGTADTHPAIQYHDTQIVKSVLAQFLNLGQGGKGGSRALSADHSQLFELSLQAIAKQIQGSLNEVIKRLVDLNWTVKHYPTIDFGKIGDEDVSGLATAIMNLVSAKALTPDAAMEQTVRTVLNLPDLPEEYREDYANRPYATGSPVPAPAAPPADPNDPNADPNEDPNADPNTDDDNTDNLHADDALAQAQAARRQLIAAVEAD